jgi:hypothetical protein
MCFPKVTSKAAGEEKRRFLSSLRTNSPTEDGRLIVSGCSHADEGGKIHCFIGLYRLCLFTGRRKPDLSLTTDGLGYTMCRQIRTGVSSLTFAFQVHSLQVLVSALVSGCIF